MNLFKQFAWLLILSAVSFSSQMLYAQQEVDPDHFDQRSAQVQKSAAVHHQKQARKTVAHKGKHRRKHAVA
jgi:hypothetical protein